MVTQILVRRGRFPFDEKFRYEFPDISVTYNFGLARFAEIFGNFFPGNFFPGNFFPGNFFPGNFFPGNFFREFPGFSVE